MAAVAIAALALTACGGPQAPKDGFVLPPTTKILSDASLALITSAAGDGTVTFSDTTAQLSGLEVGDIVVAGVAPHLPAGMLRRVTAIEPQGAGVTLRTENVRIQDAVQSGHVTVTRTLHGGDVQGSSVAPGVRLQDQTAGGGAGFTVAVDVPLDDAGDASLSGSLGVAADAGINLGLTLDVSDFGLDTFDLTVSGQETFQGDLVVTGKTGFDQRVTLATFLFTPIVIPVPTPVGVFPLVLIPELELFAGASGSVDASLSASVTQDAQLTMVLGYQNGAWVADGSSDGHEIHSVPAVDANATVTAFGGPRVSLALYGIVSAYAEAQASLVLDASLSGTPPCLRWDLDAATDAKAGASFIADHDAQLFHQAATLQSYDGCAGEPPPPQASTWARSYHRVGSVGESARAFLPIEGGYVALAQSDLIEGITGAGAAAWLLDLDADGNVVWQRAYGDTHFIDPIGLLPVGDGYVIALGDGLVAVDGNGSVRWARRYALADHEYGRLASVVALPTGGFIGVGQARAATDGWIARFAADGSVVWSETLGHDPSGAQTNEWLSDVVLTSDGDLVAVGTDATAAGLEDVWVVRFATDGSVSWETSLDDRYDSNGSDPGGTLGPGNDVGLGIAETSTGFAIAAETYTQYNILNGIGSSAWILQIDPDGALVSNTIRTVLQQYAAGFAVVEDGDVLVMVGQTRDGASTPEDAWLAVGGVYRVFGGDGRDTVGQDLAHADGRALALASDGGILLGVTSDSFDAHDEMWLLRLGTTGDVTFAAGSGAHGTNVAGQSQANGNATAYAVAATPAALPLTVTDITSGLHVESTPYVVTAQAP